MKDSRKCSLDGDAWRDKRVYPQEDVFSVYCLQPSLVSFSGVTQATCAYEWMCLVLFPLSLLWFLFSLGSPLTPLPHLLPSDNHPLLADMMYYDAAW